jgi:glycosyltransferase involved in cell wall biosynthesis
VKVLHLTNYFFPESSGTTTRLYNLISRLPFGVQVATSNRTLKGDFISPETEQLGNITVNRLPLRLGTPAQNSIWQAQNTVRHDTELLAEFAAKQQFDIIHAHNSLVFGQAAVRTRGKTRWSFVFEYHGLAQESLRGRLRGVKSFYIGRADRAVMGRCDRIICLTNRLKEWLTVHYKVPDAKITVVPNGADIDFFKPAEGLSPKSQALKNSFGINGKVVMYAGVMDSINGLEDLAAVAPQIIGEQRETGFIFLGGPLDNNCLAALAGKYPNNVKLVSSVPYNRMPDYYGLCDIFIIPRPSSISSETIIPMKLLEAMAMGKTVVASDVGGLAEVIRDHKNGYLFKKGNLASLKNTLLEALGVDNTQIGINARQTITERYTWDRSVNALIKIYEDLAVKG